MAKIKQEEYEVLKESQEKGYLLIARMKEGHLIRFREHRGKSEQRWLVTTNKEDSKYGSVHNPNDLFQFIQWSDSEPYSIAELIEEYECSAEHVSHVVNERVKALGKAWSESEETEVKKNKEWLIKRVENYIPIKEYQFKSTPMVHMTMTQDITK